MCRSDPPTTHSGHFKRSLLNNGTDESHVQLVFTDRYEHFGLGFRVVAVTRMELYVTVVLKGTSQFNVLAFCESRLQSVQLVTDGVWAENPA